MSRRRLPDWMVERLRAGDLDPARAAETRARLEAEGGLDRLEALRQDDREFLEARPPGPALAAIRRSAEGREPRPHRPRPALWLPIATAAVAGMALLVVRPLTGSGPQIEDARLKGLAAHLEIHRQRPGMQPELLADGAIARVGDLVQLSYVSADAPYGAVVSVDGRGSLTLHWPEGGGPAAPLVGGHSVPLPHAYRLDDAPAFERFFLVTASAPFDSGVVVEAARRLAASDRAASDPLFLPAGLEQRALTLRKAP
jgi:hypothetical protein